MHNEKRSHWQREAAIQCFTGCLYGASATIVGHPFDTIKTKMQAQSGFMGKEGVSMGYVQSVKAVWGAEGFSGFYKGWAPTIIGSVLFRSAIFTVYELTYSAGEKHQWMKNKIPGTDFEWRILIGGINAGTTRALIECPFEYMKVKRQTGQVWSFRSIYTGFMPQYIRSTGMLTWYFMSLNFWRRHTNLWDYKLG